MKAFAEMTVLEKIHALEELSLELAHHAERDMRHAIHWNNVVTHRIAAFREEIRLLREANAAEITAELPQNGGANG